MPHAPVADPVPLEVQQPFQGLPEQRTRFLLIKPTPVRHRIEYLASIVERRHDVKVFVVPKGLRMAGVREREPDKRADM